MMIAADTIAREAYRNTNNNTAAPAGGKFCTQCGKSMPAEALFCSGCGAKL
jgi:predicted amidophosphoribosyltransferase